MDFLEFGKSIEKSGIGMYDKLAIECPVIELAGVFKFLALEEHRHFEILDAWQKCIEPPDIDSTAILGAPEMLFRKLADSFGSRGASVLNYSNTYQKALQFERVGLEAYEEALDKLENEEQRHLLLVMINQEKFHVHLLSSLLDYNRQSSEFLGNAMAR
jgi:rubrerythrin